MAAPTPDAMTVSTARNLLAEFADLFADSDHGQAARVILDDHEQLVGRRNARTGAREAKIMAYARTLPAGTPLSPIAVQAALDFEHSPASAMANLADKGQLVRLGKAAVYRLPA